MNKIKKEEKYIESKEEREKEYKEYLNKKESVKKEKKEKEKREAEKIIKLFEEENERLFEKKQRTKEILSKYRKEDETNLRIKLEQIAHQKSRDANELAINLNCMKEVNVEEEKLKKQKMKMLKKNLDYSATFSKTNSNFFKHNLFEQSSKLERIGFRNKIDFLRNYKEKVKLGKKYQKSQSTELEELLLEQQALKDRRASKQEEAKKKQKRKLEEENIKQIEIQIQSKKEQQTKEKKDEVELMKKINEDYNSFLKEEQSKIESNKKKSKSYYDEVKKQIEEKKSRIIPEMSETEYFINKKLLESAERSLNKIEKKEISPYSTFYT